MQRFYFISFITEIIYVIEAKNVNKDSPLLLKGNHLNFFSPGTFDSVWKGMMDCTQEKNAFTRMLFSCANRLNYRLMLTSKTD